MSGSGVSVVVPVLNGEKYLAEAIESLLAQSRPPLEVVIVDDGSTDGTAEVARCYGEVVRYERQEHAGGGAALNRGIGLARGELLAFLDADDLWLPEKLELQLEALSREPGLSLVFGHVRQFHSPELPPELKQRIHCPAELVPGRSVVTMLATREACQRVGQFATRYRTGWFLDWYMRAADLGMRDRMLPEVVAMRRLHGSNLGIREASARGQYAQILKAGLDRRRSLATGGE